MVATGIAQQHPNVIDMPTTMTIDRYSSVLSDDEDEESNSPPLATKKKVEPSPPPLTEVSLDRYSIVSDQEEEREPLQLERRNSKSLESAATSNNVSFAKDPVTQVTYIPRLNEHEKALMFYRPRDFSKWRKELNLHRNMQKRQRQHHPKLAAKLQRAQKWRHMNSKQFRQWETETLYRRWEEETAIQRGYQPYHGYYGGAFGYYMCAVPVPVPVASPLALQYTYADAASQQEYQT